MKIVAAVTSQANFAVGAPLFDNPAKMAPKMVGVARNGNGGQAQHPRTLLHGMLEIKDQPESGWPRFTKAGGEVSWWVQVSQSQKWCDEAKDSQGRVLQSVTRNFKLWKRRKPKAGPVKWDEYPAITLAEEKKQGSKRWNQVCWNPITGQKGEKLARLVAMIKFNIKNQQELKNAQGETKEGDHNAGDWGWGHLEWSQVQLSEPRKRE